MRKPFFALMLGATVAACGGNVVVDGTSPGGGATTSATTSVTTVTGAAGSASCFTPPPAGSLVSCGSSGSGSSCSFNYCETGSTDAWQAECTTASCVCLKNGQELCTCALATDGNFCGGTPDCCFH